MTPVDASIQNADERRIWLRGLCPIAQLFRELSLFLYGESGEEISVVAPSSYFGDAIQQCQVAGERCAWAASRDNRVVDQINSPLPDMKSGRSEEHTSELQSL